MEFCTKKKRFSVEQIVAVLKEAEAGMPVADLISRVGIAEQMFYRWKNSTAAWIVTRRDSSSNFKTKMNV